MSSIREILLLLILSTILNANSYQKIILDYSRDRDSIKSRLNNAKELSKGYNLKYNIEDFGNYFAITISSTDGTSIPESLYLTLTPHFPDMFIINQTNNQNRPQGQQTTLLAESIKKIEEVKKSDIVEYTRDIHRWLDKWYILIILTLLGFYFYYRKLIKISDIQTMQSDFSKDQDRMSL